VRVPAAEPALVGASSTGIPNRAAPEVIPPGEPVSEAPTTRFTAAQVKPPKEERDVTSWLGDLRNRGLRRTEPTAPSAEPTVVNPTVATPTVATANPATQHPTNPPVDIAADETRAIPVSRPENADSAIATEQLNARGGGVSAQDLLRREGRL
jgi:RND superfamily putative drug exporter